MRIHSRHGFTLIELLVVISIIAILASMLLPAVGMIRDMANQQKCGNNERQFALAIAGYAADNDGLAPMPGQYEGGDSTKPSLWWSYTPFASILDSATDSYPNPLGAGNWWGREMPDRLKCPSAEGKDSQNWDKSFISYGYNYNVGANQNYHQSGPQHGPYEWWTAADCENNRSTLPIDKIKAASSKVALVDNEYFLTWYLVDPSMGNWSWWYIPNAVDEAGVIQGWSPWVVLRHRGKAEAAFWDGHVQSLRDTDVNSPGNTNEDAARRFNLFY